MTNQESVQKVLWAMSRWNDRVQDWIFDPNRLAPEFPESRITQPFPFNAFYGIDEAPVVEPVDLRLEVSGLVREKKPWTLPELYALPQVSQITRHICVEGWSAIGKWSGVRFSDFLAAHRRGHDGQVRRLQVRRRLLHQHRHADGIASADRAHFPLRRRDPARANTGFPMKLRMPTKLGFKNPKHIVALFVTNAYPGGYWEDQGYNWYSGS